MSERLPPIAGEWIDRSRPLRFRFEGTQFSGFAGDTVSSALAAAGVRALGRSFKYHRLRGILSMANHDVNAMMQWGAQLNLRADVTPLQEGMDLKAVNTRGGLRRDRLSLLDKLSKFLPVGFYYKAFHRPKAWFPFWEKLIRATSGLGELKFDAPRIKTPKRYAFTDVLVIGAGPSGLAAALAAAQQGLKVVIVDENPKAGGTLTYQRDPGDQAAKTCSRLCDAIAQNPNIQMMLATEAAGYYADHWVPLVDAERMTKMRARAVIVAAGAFEQPAVFRNNDLPGVMLASAAQRLIHRYGVKPMQRAVVLAANLDGYRAALDLHAHGVEVAALVDMRPGESSALAHEIAKAGIKALVRGCIAEALPNAGKDGLSAVMVAPLTASGEAVWARCERIACDGVVMSVGWSPALNLLYQAGTKVRYDERVQQFVPAQLPAGIFAAGRINGIYAPEEKIKDGTRAGLEAARHLGADCTAADPVPVSADSPSHPYPIIAHPSGKNFVDFDEDLQLKDFFDAAQEGFDNIELLKRFTTVGMGPSQGKHSNMNSIRILARIKGRSIDEIGSTTARPFFHPVPLSHLAGRSFHPERVTPMHTRHQQADAKFMQAGPWLRPEYYRAGSMSKEDAVRAEVRAVRNSLGIIDVGTLGKLEVYGPDAGEFLERVYTGRFANMKVASTRYCLMCDESGVMIDDGVVARLGEQQFYFTTTTTGSATVYRELTRLNAMWRLNVGIVNVTGHYAAVNLAGPNARALLAPLSNIDLTEAAFPYLGVREGEVAGMPARLLRVGFVGELGYEIHVPAQYGMALWDVLMQEGARHDIQAFGVEAQRLLRLEKAHVIIGQDSDGLTTPFEAASGFAVKMDKPFFIGQRSLKIIQSQAPRQSLVAFTLADGRQDLMPKECHLVIHDGQIAGRVTSIAYSEAVGKVIGLAFVTPEKTAVGSQFLIRVDGGALVQASVVKAPFYDPEGLRQKAVPA
jgi:sarcosine oxidase, subunit alpha